MSEGNELVRSTREALKAILELARELREIEEPPGQNWPYTKDGRNYTLSPARALDEAEAYALHFLRSNLFTHGEIAETAARLLGPAVFGTLQALEVTKECLAQTEEGGRWLTCGEEFIQQVGPNLVDFRENLPLALLKSPAVQEFEEATNYLGALAETIERLKTQTESWAKEAQVAAEEANSFREKASEEAQAAESLKGEAESALEKVNSILEEAQSLEEDIENFKEEFQALSSDHKALAEALKERQNELESLLERANEQQQRINEILEAAKEALGWAQASGLAGASHESVDQYRKALGRKGWGLAIVIVFLAGITTAYLVYGPAWIARFLDDLKQAGIEPGAYITWFVKVLSFVPLLALGYGVWTMGVDYAVLRNLAHSYRHREVLARTLQAFRELVSEEESSEITRKAFELFLQDPMARAYRGSSPLQRATGELKTLVGRAKGQVDIVGSEESGG